MPNNIELLASDSRGVYIPQHIAETCDLEPIRRSPQNVARLESNLCILKEGPEAEGYWEAWDDVVDSACIRVGRARWSLYQNGDCWAIRMNSRARKEAAEAFDWG